MNSSSRISHELDFASGSIGRWAISGSIAALLTSIFLLITQLFHKEIVVLDAPPIELDYITLPSTQKKEEPSKPKKIPRVKVPSQVIETTQPTIAPTDATPDAESIAPSLPIVSSSSEKAPSKETTTRISSAEDLDNTDFSPLFNPKPSYPQIALQAGIEGYVDVDLLIDDKGRVESYSIGKISGHPQFGIETSRVIGKWRFPPPRIKGKKLKVNYMYRIKFALN